MKLASLTSTIRANIISRNFGKILKQSHSVLDIGCGTGVVLKTLSNRFEFSKAVGCDIDKYLIENIEFVFQSKDFELPFKKSVFDLAMFNDVLHHIPYVGQEKLLRQSLRVSKCVIVFELYPGVINRAGDIMLNKIHNPRMSVPLTYRTPKEWKNLFTKLGFNYKVVSINKPFLYPFKHIGFIVNR